MSEREPSLLGVLAASEKEESVAKPSEMQSFSDEPSAKAVLVLPLQHLFFARSCAKVVISYESDRFFRGEVDLSPIFTTVSATFTSL